MGTPDPWEAASRAVEWVKQHQRESRAEKDQQQNQKDSSLHAYWEKWFHRTSESKKTARLNYRKWEGEQQNLWLAQGYGLKHQPFALKSVDAITYSDLATTGHSSTNAEPPPIALETWVARRNN